MPNADERNYSRVVSIFIYANSIAEQTLLSLDPSQYDLFKGIWIDLNALTQFSTLKAKQSINDSDISSIFETIIYIPGVSNPAILFAKNAPADGLVTITLQSSVLEGASRNIPIEYWLMNLGTAPS